MSFVTQLFLRCLFGVGTVIPSNIPSMNVKNLKIVYCAILATNMVSFLKIAQHPLDPKPLPLSHSKPRKTSTLKEVNVPDEKRQPSNELMKSKWSDPTSGNNIKIQNKDTVPKAIKTNIESVNPFEGLKCLPDSDEDEDMEDGDYNPAEHSEESDHDTDDDASVMDGSSDITTEELEQLMKESEEMDIDNGGKTTGFITSINGKPIASFGNKPQREGLTAGVDDQPAINQSMN
ncbi:hypothetical protein BD770DRAFT_408358 [Pilaira anomala]|nr:hypothetical protein BD770DRAFT_408358 [Pilaira anomala]